MQTLSEIFASALADDLTGNDGQYSAVAVKDIHFEPVEIDSQNYSPVFPGITMTVALTPVGSELTEEYPLSVVLSPNMSYCDELGTEQECNPAVALFESRISDVDTILDYLGLDRANILEHEGFIDSIEMPAFMRDVFVELEMDDKVPRFDNEDDAKLFHEIQEQIEASGREPNILFETQGGYDAYYGNLVNVAFMPKDVHRETPAIEEELSFEQREVLDAFLDEVERLGTSPSTTALIDSFGNIEFVPKPLLEAAEERLAQRFAVSKDSLAAAVEETQKCRTGAAKAASCRR